MGKRSIATVKCYDYTSKEEFEKDIEPMKEKGYRVIEKGMFNGAINHGEIVGSENKWKYSAWFLKETL